MKSGFSKAENLYVAFVLGLSVLMLIIWTVGSGYVR